MIQCARLICFIRPGLQGQQPAFVTSGAAAVGGGGEAKGIGKEPPFPQSQRQSGPALKTSAVLLQSWAAVPDFVPLSFSSLSESCRTQVWQGCLGVHYSRLLY